MGGRCTLRRLCATSKEVFYRLLKRAATLSLQFYECGVGRAGRAVAADSDSDDEESEGSPPDTRRAGSIGEAAMGGPLSGGLTIPASSDDPGARVL